MGYFNVEDKPEDLAHFGIPGMKWGIRRFENKDGSLTPAGRARYDKFKKSKELGDARDKAYSNFMKKGADLVKKNPKLKSEVGDGIDDDELLYQQVNDHYSPKSKELADFNKLYDDYWDARTESRRFDSANKKEIAEGKKIADKIINSNKDTKTNSDTVKKLAIAGAAVAGAGLAAYGVYKIRQLNKQATEGIRSEARSQSKQMFKISNLNRKMAYDSATVADNIKRNNGGHTDLSKVLAESSNKRYDRADYYLGKAFDYDKKASQKNYSLKEKVNYLKENKAKKNR